MIKYYCDICGKELTRKEINALNKIRKSEGADKIYPPSDECFKLEINKNKKYFKVTSSGIVKTNGIACKDCSLKIINLIDSVKLSEESSESICECYHKNHDCDRCYGIADTERCKCEGNKENCDIEYLKEFEKQFDKDEDIQWIVIEFKKFLETNNQLEKTINSYSMER